MKRSPMPRRKTPMPRATKPMRRKRLANPRRPKHHDHAWLAECRAFGCWCCLVDGCGWVASEPHHPKGGGKAAPGAGQKSSDSLAIPLCRKHHNEKHPDSLSIHRDPIEFRKRYGTEPEILAQVKAEVERRKAASLLAEDPFGDYNLRIEGP